MAALDTGKVKSSSLKQGAKARNIKGKQINYRTGKTKSARVQKVRPISAYTKKYNTKRVYLYSMMTKAEKMKMYDKERRAVISEMKKLSKMGYDSTMIVLDEVGGSGAYTGLIPTARQMERMSQRYGGLASFRGKQEIERMIQMKEELLKIRKGLESSYGKDDWRTDQKLLNAIFDKIEDTREKVSKEQIGKTKPQSEDLLRYKEKGLKQDFYNWLTTGTLEEIKAKYDSLRKQYEYISDKILQYFRDSDESYKSEVRKNSSAVFQTTVVTNIHQILRSTMKRYAIENGVVINNY